MPPSEKAKIVIEAKDKASKEMKNARKEFGKLVGAIAAGNVAANLADKALGSLTKGFGALVGATKVAARIQVLNRVVNLTGKAAGLTAIELEDNKNAIIKLGIAEQEALSIQQRFIQVQLDIGDAVKIARVAQDLAVIAGTNSSDTALLLTDALVKQRPILLKQFGIIADLNVIYGKQAHALGITVDQLDKTQKRQAFLNEILEQSKTVAGAYESAMKDVGKRLTSLPRHVQNAQNAIGQLFLPVLGAAVDGTADFLKAIKILGDSLNTSLPKAVKASAAALREFGGTKEFITELLDEYKKLSAKTNRSEEEHRKLDTAIKAIGKTLPGAITKWDEYGDAVEISADAVERLVAQQENVLKAKFIQNVGRLRTEFTELSKVDLGNVVEELAKLAKERERMSKLTISERGGIVGEKKTSDPLRRVNALFETLNALLLDTSERKREIIALSSTMYPQLEKGTEDYKNALIFLQQELFNAVLEHQNLADSEVKAKTGSDELVKSTKENVIGLSQYVIGLETVEGKLQLVKQSFLDVADAFPDQDSPAFLAPADYSERWQVAISNVTEDTAEYTSFAITEAGNVTTSVISNLQRQGKEYEKFHKIVNEGIEEESQGRKTLNQAIGDITMRGVNRMTDELMTGKVKAGRIFESMAQDFARFFIQQALIKLITIFIPGMGKILQGMFDTPANDRMAMEQGEHFTQWFTRGALGAMAGFPTTFASAAAGNLATGGVSMLFPDANNGGGRGGGGINMTFHNPIMTQNFVEDDVVDIIEQASRDGGNTIVINDANLTGQEDGTII